MSILSSSENSRVSSLCAFNLSVALKSSMSVHINNHYQSKVYTSMSSLSGHVKIITSRDVRFDKVQILLLGSTKTRVDTISSPHATAHTFLKLEMPLDYSSYPVPRVYEAGRTYTIPFNFVIPQQLTLSACRHHSDRTAIQDHLCLPPTMGMWQSRDDFSPDMASVEYRIIAQVFRDEEMSKKHIKVMTAFQPIKVLPAFSEEPPLNVTEKDRLYIMSKSNTLRKSLLTRKLGKVTVNAAQPGAVMLSADGRSISSTDAVLDLDFKPASSDSTPPNVTKISSKITAVTFLSSGGINCYPNLGDWNRSFGADGKGSYSSSMSLFSTTVEKTKWQHRPTSQTRGDSGYSSLASDHSRSSIDHGHRRNNNSKNKNPLVDYTTKLQVPIKLPVDKKMFIPSFHSCIASRAYVLQMTVSLSAGSTTSTVSVAVPLQIGVPTVKADVDATGLPSFAAAVEEAEGGDYLGPRILSAPEVELGGHVLPGYADLMGRRMVAAN